MPRSLFALTLCCSLLFACGDGLEQREETDALGHRLVWKVDPETELRQGLAQEFDTRGRLVVEEFYRDGNLHGERKIFLPDGKVEVLENYLDGQFEGDYLNYDSLGQISLKGQYVDGAMNKAWYLYYPDGKVKEVVTFVDNEENGPFREWYPDGKPKASGEYREGDNEDGLLHLYAETGGLERVLRCSMKLCNTIWSTDSTGVAPKGVDMTMPGE